MRASFAGFTIFGAFACMGPPCPSCFAQGQAIGWGTNSAGELGPGFGSLLGSSHVSANNFTVAVRTDGTVFAWGRNMWGQTNVPSGLAGVTRVEAGGYHCVALLNDGTVKSWGNYLYTGVPAGLGGVTQVAAGYAHSLALRSTGTVEAWGNNDYGQRTVPSDLTGVVGIAGGFYHSLALLHGGSVRAWGAGLTNTGTLPQFGQSIIPAGLGSVTQVAAGYYHSLALKSDGSVAAWGRNDAGQCAVPAGLTGVRLVKGGALHCLALKADGTVVAWGGNAAGQCDVPTGLLDVVHVAAGDDHSVALKRDGTIVAWGGNWSGQASVPQSVTEVVQLSSYSHTLALVADGTVRAWGWNSYGESDVPDGLVGVIQVSAGGDHSLALRSNGTVQAWGRNNFGQLNIPAGLSGVVGIAAGGSFDGGHNLALLSNGTIRAWGDNRYNQAPSSIGLSGAVQVAAGGFHSMALLASGTVSAWGAGTTTSGTYNYGQSIVPAGLTGVTQISAGGMFSAARRSNGQITIWGDDRFGQRSQQPAGLAAVAQVAAGESHVAVLLADGTVRGWGLNTYGEASTPSGIGGVTQVEAGSAFTMALVNSTASSCANPSGIGTATLAVSGSAWQDLGVWSWSTGANRQVPGSLSNVTLGEYGSVGSLCDAQCATLAVPSTSTLLVPVDLRRPLAEQDHSIAVGGIATLRGRVWLLASGASVLPADFSLPVVNAGNFDGLFTIIQTTVPPPAGKFLTLVPTAGLVGGGWSLALRDLPSSLGTGTGAAGSVLGVAVAAEAIDYNGDGFDDLALVIDNGAAIPGALQVILNDGTGSLGSVSYRMDTAARPTSLGVGDVNGDGKADAVVGAASNASAGVFLNSFPQVSPPFSPSTQLATVASPLSVAVLPWPNPRVAVGTSAGAVSIFNPAASAAVQSTTVPVTPTTTRPRGRVIVTGGANPNSVDGLLPPANLGRLVVLTPDLAGTYAVTQQIDVPGKPVNMDIADIDRDGVEDALTANAEPQQLAPGTQLAVLTLFRGTATGFSTPTPIAPQGASAGGDAAMVDVNADGVRDIVTVHQTTVGQSAASAILVNQATPGGPLTLGTQEPITAVRPILCPRGLVRGPAGEGVYIVDAGSSAFDGGGSFVQAAPPVAIPYRAQCRGDLDGNGVVAGFDLGTLLAHWGTSGPLGDLDRSGLVDGLDLALLLSEWGPCDG